MDPRAFDGTVGARIGSNFVGKTVTTTRLLAFLLLTLVFVPSTASAQSPQINVPDDDSHRALRDQQNDLRAWEERQRGIEEQIDRNREMLGNPGEEEPIRRVGADGLPIDPAAPSDTAAPVQEVPEVEEEDQETAAEMLETKGGGILAAVAFVGVLGAFVVLRLRERGR